MRAKEFIIEQQIEEGWKSALAGIGLALGAMVAGVNYGTQKASEPYDPPSQTKQDTGSWTDTTKGQTLQAKDEIEVEKNKDTTYNIPKSDTSKKAAILKDIDTMASIIYSNYKLGWERGQTLSFMQQQGWLNGPRLEMAQNIANLAYSMPKGYWTVDEFRAIVRKEITPSIPDNL